MSVRRARCYRAPLEDFSRMFLEEIATANRSFVRSQSEIAAELADASRHPALALALGAPASEGAMLAQALEAQAAAASRLAIVDATITFWLEPVGPSLWQRIVWWLFPAQQNRAAVQLYRLAPARRRFDALRLEVRIGAPGTQPLESQGPHLLPPELPT
jgi:hypothetical protein